MKTFSQIYHACDFYLPKKFLTQDFKKKIQEINSTIEWEFITPESEISLSDPKPNSIRIISSFPLSDETYRGLYFFTKGDVVGYGGDDGFSLALSSGKLPFPVMTRDETAQWHLIYSVIRGSLAIDSYFRVAYQKAMDVNFVARRGTDIEEDLKLVRMRDVYDIEALRARWFRYATEMFENPDRNGFVRMKNIVEKYLEVP